MGERIIPEKRIHEVIWSGSPYRSLEAIIEHLESSDIQISWDVLRVLGRFLQLHNYEVFGAPVRKAPYKIVRGGEEHEVPASEGAWGEDWEMPELGIFWEFPAPHLDCAIPFVKSLLRDKQVSRILDIATVPQSLVFPIEDEFKSETIEAIPHYMMQNDCELLTSKLFPDSIIKWRKSDSVGSKFDVVLGTLCPVERDSIGLRAQLDKACNRLSSSGIGIFHVHTSFFVSEDMREFPYGPFGDAEKFYLQAALVLPGMSTLTLWEDEWFANEYLIIVSQGKQDDLFVGEISADIDRAQMLLNNLKARKNGTPMRHGLVTTAEYVAKDESEMFRYQFAIDELRDLQLVPLSEYIDRIEFVGQEPSGFRAVHGGLFYNLSPYGLEIDLPSGFVRENVLIVSDTDRVNPIYLATFLDQHMGRNWWIDDHLELSKCETETDIIHRILNTGVYLPELKLQESILRAITGVRNLSTDIEIMRKTLWKSPERVENSLTTFGEKTFESWLTTLPYPLASILWIYNATANPRRKVEHLLNFFEALSQFNATLMLSGFFSDEDYFTNNIQNLIKPDEEYRDSFVRSSFGTWNILMKKLAKFMRVQLDQNSTRETCLNLFSNPPLYTLKMISDKRIGKLLDDACNHRNRWKGHTGVTGDDEIKHRLTVLEDLLSKLRSVISNNFDGFNFLMRLEEIEFKNQIHKYRIRHLKGYSIHLQEDEVKTDSPMQNDQIYFLGEKSLHPIVLLPFVLMHTSEKTSSLACYFYSRWEKDVFHLVSYHYEEDSEIMLSDDFLESAIKILVPNDESKKR